MTTNDPFLLAGAEALEAQGEWHLHVFRGKRYMVPADKWNEWCTWEENVEPGEYTELVPEWAKPVPEKVIVTGWRKP